MAGLIENIERRTGMVGQNRMEMLLFRLPNRKQLYGMNVFKILEILPCPHLTIMPKLHKSVIGVLNHRGTTSSVIDLSLAMEGPKTDDYRKYLLVMSEYNNSVQGFIVSKVERIVDYSWDKIMIPPSGLGNKAYLTAVTEYQNELVEIVDVEKIFSEISPYEEIVDNNNGERFETYIIKGERGSGCVCLNGAAARKVQVGDVLIIISYAIMDFEEAKQFKPTVVFPDTETNKVITSGDKD